MGLLKIAPLGGCGEIGKNCTVIEQNDEIIVVDCGISFPHEEHHGVDIVIPDFTYLVENQKKIKGIVITHAHEDHIGALGFLLAKIKAPIYCSALTEAFIRRRIEERINPKDVDIRPLKFGQKLDIGLFTVEPIRMTHSIPENAAIAIWTEHGIVLMSGDFKFDLNPVDKKLSDTKRLAELGEEGVLILMCDSTNVLNTTWTGSESEVKPGLVEIMSEAPGRVMVTTFSSQIHRMQQVADAAKETGRYISVAGRRMNDTFQMCRKMGYLHVEDRQYVPIEDIARYKPEELTILVTGSQGEHMAALSQMSRQEYTRLKVVEGDTIIYSARPIPGNEGGIWRTVNRLVKLGADVISDYHLPVHVSGHASAIEIRLLMRLTQPFYLAPVHGEARHQKAMCEMFVNLGHPQHRIFTLNNGDVLALDDQKAWLSGTIPSGADLVDQNSHAIVTDKVLRERTILANDGIFILHQKVDLKLGELTGYPSADAKGFICDDEDMNDILEEISSQSGRIDSDALHSEELLSLRMSDIASRAIWHRTKQKPLISVVVIDES